jgi:hypothetical protein
VLRKNNMTVPELGPAGGLIVAGAGGFTGQVDRRCHRFCVASAVELLAEARQGLTSV